MNMAPVCPNCCHVFAALLMLAASVSAQGQWQKGRATFYGGSCGHYYLDPNKCTGWDVAALTDAVWDFGGSCGRCYEIKCDPANVHDGYGQNMDRTSVCYDPDASVVVQITDSCPCNYPTNYYSNKRCLWAYEKLADRRWGVIGTQFRVVPCDYKPAKPASVPRGHSPSPGYSFPANYKGDTRWCPSGTAPINGPFQQGYGPSSSPASGSSSSYDSSSNSRTGGQYGGPGSNVDIFIGGFKSGWSDGSWSVSKWQWPGVHSGQAQCASVSPNGGIAFTTQPGAFQHHVTLQFWVRATDNGKTPAMTVRLSSPKGDCKAVDVSKLTASEWRGDWGRYDAYLPSFSWDAPGVPWISAYADAFRGCGGGAGIGAWDVDRVQFVNPSSHNSMSICVDAVQIF